MASFLKNKIHSDIKLRYIKKSMFVCQCKKKAAHGDMSRFRGEALRYVKKHSYRGRYNLHYHHVACQAFFSFFLKKIVAWISFYITC
jgi:hypothetical protein